MAEKNVGLDGQEVERPAQPDETFAPENDTTRPAPAPGTSVGDDTPLTIPERPAPSQGPAGPEGPDSDREREMAFRLPRVSVVSAIYGRVGAHEKHAEHPGGEAWVGDTPVEVGATPYILQRLKEGNLVEVGDGGVVKEALDEAARTTAARIAMQQESERAQAKRARLDEEAGDAEVAAVWSQALAHAAKGPDQHAADADAAKARAADLRKQAARV